MKPITERLAEGRIVPATLDGVEWFLTDTDFFPAQDFWTGDRDTRHPKYKQRPVSESLSQWVDRVAATGAVFERPQP